MLHHNQGQFPQVAAAPVGVYGDDFSDAPNGRLGLTSRPATGSDGGVTYGWAYNYIVAGNLSTDEMVWLPIARDGIQRETFPVGGTPAGNFMCPFDLGAAHFVSCQRANAGVNINFGPSLGGGAAVTNDLTGTVHITVTSPTSNNGTQIEQFTNSAGGRSKIGDVGPSPYGCVVRMEVDPVTIGVDIVRCYPDYVANPGSYEDIGTVVPLAGNYAGIAVRRAGDPSTATIYSNFRCGSL